MKPRKKVYLLEEFPSEAVQFCRSRFDTILSTDPEVKNWRQNSDAILVRETIITACKGLRAIGKQSTDIDIIDQEACQAVNIKILNTLGVNAGTVAELTLCLALAVARQIRPISVRQAQGEEVRKEHCCGQTLKCASLGIVGMGAIGRKVAGLFRAAFDCEVYAYDPFMPKNAWEDLPHTKVDSIDAMLPHIDLLSLHVPLNKDTKGLIALPQLRCMRSNAILLNLARGGLVKEDDLVVALEEGMIWGAGLKCHEVEPPTSREHQRLWKTGRVVSTPHIGATCASTQVKTATAAIENAAKFFD